MKERISVNSGKITYKEALFLIIDTINRNCKYYNLLLNRNNCCILKKNAFGNKYYLGLRINPELFREYSIPARCFNDIS